MDMLLFLRTSCRTVGRRSAASLIALLLVGWSGAGHAFWSLGMIPGVYIPQTYYKHGAVYTRAIVLSPAGNPYYVEYDDSGNEGREIAEKTGEYERAQIMAGAYYRSLLQRLTDAKTRYPEHEELSAADYRGSTFKTAGGETIQKPSIAPDTLTVLVRAENNRYLKDGSDLLLLELPIKASVQPSASSQSILLSEAGDILHQTANTIAFRVGFFGKDGKVATNLRRDHDSEIYGKMPSVPVSLGGHIAGGFAITDADGKYRMNYFLPACPGFTFDYTTPVYLELYYSRFNPRGSSMMPYYLVRQDYDFCNGLGVYSMGAAMVIATMATPVKPKFDFPVDLMVVDGAAAFSNVQLGDKTAYNPETSDYAKTVQDAYDFDGDEKPEIIVPGKKVKKTIDGQEREVFVETAVAEAELQGIYLSSRHSGKPASTEETAPDFTRLIDTTADFKDRGLLQSISKDDLRDTDIYVFRESTGQLVAERRGLHENELYKTFSGVDDKQGSFRFTIQLRGAVENHFALAGRNGEANFTKWQSAGGFTEAFQKRTGNHLKSGEQVRIIAINRPTGYMGSARINLNAALNGNMIDLNQARIQLTPPNLKVWAERKNKIERGMTKGEEKKQLIGNEGAGLGSDISIAIYTDWRDQDGGPLPEALADYGYTGRLAKIVAANQLAPVGANNLSQFKIKPGQQVQVIQLPEKVLAKQHLYLQVAGQPENRNPDFATGNGEGILKYRPSKYVPVQVPLHDEQASEIARQAYRKADKEHPGLNLKKPEPMYAWKYRPEMQFSLYELNVKEVRKVDADNIAKNIYENKLPTLTSSDRYVDFIYDLLRSSFDVLGAFSYAGERELVFAFGEEEVKATVGESQSIRFENIDHLGSLDADDFTSLRLYTNNDVGNTLWEFAFETLFLESLNIGFKEETGDSYYLSADEPTLDFKARLLGYAGRDPEKKTPVTVRWSVEGAGSLSHTTQSSGDIGVFDNALVMPTQKGATAKIFVEMLDNPESKTTWKTVKVTAGEPARVTTRVTGQAEALEQGQARIDVEVFDRFNNYVEDNTPISFQLNESLRIVEQQLATKNGRAYIVITGGELDSDSAQAVISVGQVSENVQLSVKGSTVALTASTTQVKKGERVTLTAEVKRYNGLPAVGVPVLFSAGHGVLENPYGFTDASGIAKSTFIAGLNAQDDTWRANVGYLASAEVDYQIKSNNGRSIEAQEAMLVADVSQPGVVSYDNFGVSVQAAYEVSGSVQVLSDSAGTVRLGDMFDPNIEPLLSLQMSALDTKAEGKQVFSDEVGLNDAVVTNVDIVRDHPMGGGRSASFVSASRAAVPNSDLLDLNDGFGLRLDIKPTSVGQVFDLNGQHRLEYQDNRFVYSLRTSAGEFSVALADVEVSRWHSVAVRMWQGEIELYVDGRLAKATYSGDLSGSGSGLVVGGLEARMRSVKVFDWNSAPLIAFANDSASSSLQVGTNHLTVKSLGNLGSRVAGSKLKQLRVAVISGQERNYVSLLSRDGYADISMQIMRSEPPADLPVAQYQLTNPVSRFIPSAYAWTWEGVWEKAKSGIGLFIPYEDFITIGEQLLYWSDGDPRFEPTTLAFAAIGAATIIPVAKPLKPLLVPAKKFVEALKRFPGARHFAGAIGSAVSGGLSGNSARLAQLLPFIQLGVELYQDEEAFTFLMESIQSEDDLWVWVDYMSTLALDAGGFGDEEATAMLPPSALWLVGEGALVPYAHALTPRQMVAKKLATALRRLSRSVENPKEFTPVLKELLQAMKNESGAVKKLLADGTFLKGAMAFGAAKIRHFITSSKNWRVRREVVLFAVLYLVEQKAEGKLTVDNAKFATLLADIVSGFPYKQHGAIFQVTEMMIYQILANYGPEPKLKIVGIDMERQAYRLVSGGGGVVRPDGKAYKRRIDIVLANSQGKEQWVELKSLAGPFHTSWFDSRLSAKEKSEDASDESRDYYRQFFHDLRLNSNFVNEDNLLRITERKHAGNVDFFWYFQDFKPTPTSSKPPVAGDEGLAQKGFCQAPTGLGDVNDFYKQNMGLSVSQTKDLCKFTVKAAVSLRDTKSYFEEYLLKFAGQLEIQDFVDIVKSIGD